MPTKNETLAFKALTNEVIARFKALTRRPGRAYDALTGNETYEVPDDEISKRLVQLLEGLKSTMAPSDYSQAEIAVGEIMKLSAQRISEHHTALNEAGSQVTGGAQDGGRSYDWARDWARGKGMSADDIDEFVSGLEQHSDQPPAFAGQPLVGGGQRPLTAQDRKRMAADSARAAASSANRASFDARYPNAKRLQPGSNSNDSVAALHRHLGRIGQV